MQCLHRALTWPFSMVCLSVFLASLLIMALLLCFSEAQFTPAGQALILLQFKQLITKDPLGALHSWTSSSKEPNTSLTPQFCSWNGVTCEHRSVVSIALPGCKLEGSITSLISGLNSLTSIDLSMNSMSGFLPDTLGMLPNLKSLKLSSNSFVGSIPASLSNCSSLVLLDVSNNIMSGGIPAQLGALPALKGLFLSNNLLEGTVPPSIFNTSVLQFLDINRNRVSGVMPDSVGNAKSLLSLNLAANNLSGRMPGRLSEMVSLQGLDVSNNMLNGEIPSQLAACAFLAVVILSKNLLAGGIPAYLGEVQSLRVLQLDNNLLSGAIPSRLGNCKNLEDLVLSHNLFDGHIPTTVASLANLLLSFDMSHNLLTGPIPPQIGGMFKVVKIDLSHNKLSGNITEELGSCVGLEYIDLSNNQLVGIIPQNLGSLLSLTWMLNLSHNSLEGSIPDLQRLNYLRIMDLSYNNLTGSVPPRLLSLHDLMFLNLSFNRLSGCFPQSKSFASKHINLLSIHGNPSLHAKCSTRNSPHLAWYIWFLLIAALLVWLGIGIYFCVAGRLCGFDPTYRHQIALGLQIKQLKGFKIYSALDLNSALNSIDAHSLIGRGASSDVYRVQFADGQVCAVKVFKPTARQQLFKTELDVLKEFKHRNLMMILGCRWHGSNRAILLDYMENGSLKKQLHDMSLCILDLQMRIQIARDVAEGLMYLHHYGHVPVIHCDVKSANILLDKDYKARLADFGLATYTAGGLTNAGQTGRTSTLLRFQGTVGYIAPEYAAFRRTPSIAGDVYSYGVVLLELLTRRHPGQGNFPAGIYSLPDLVRSAKRDGNLESVLDPDLRVEMRTRLGHDKVSVLVSMGLDCANKDPIARPSMDKVVTCLKYHPTFLEPNPKYSQVTSDDVAVGDDLVVTADVDPLT